MSELAHLISSPPRSVPTPDTHSLIELVAPGRLVELCGAAQTTLASSILARVQHEGETAAWIQLVQGELYPPDLAAAGVDVEALLVVHVPLSGASYCGATGQCRAAELLLRSGGFGLVVLDFSLADPHLGSSAWQGRLLGLARQHEARVVLLRERGSQDPNSLGPLISLRLGTRVERTRPALGFIPRTASFELHCELLKNKSGGRVEPEVSTLRGPWGLA